LFQVRQEALHAEGIPSEKAARLHSAAAIGYFDLSAIFCEELHADQGKHRRIFGA
jgi:hypothetical protein